MVRVGGIRNVQLTLQTHVYNKIMSKNSAPEREDILTEKYSRQNSSDDWLTVLPNEPVSPQTLRILGVAGGTGQLVIPSVPGNNFS